jgi:hypothetical protein
MKMEHLRRVCLRKGDDGACLKMFRAVDGVDVRSTDGMGKGLFLSMDGCDWRTLPAESLVNVEGVPSAVIGVMDDPRRVSKCSWYRSCTIAVDNNMAEVEVKVFNKRTGDPVDVVLGNGRELGADEKELTSDFGIEHRGFIYYDRSLTKKATFDRNGGDFTYNGVPRESLWYRLNHSGHGNVGLVVRKLNNKSDASLRRGFVFFWKGGGRPTSALGTQLFFDYGDVPDAWNSSS